jgi:hypothetical protein
MLAKARAYLRNYRELGDVVPTREGMADELGVALSTIYKWADEHPEFSDALEAASAKQARALISGGLSGDMQPTIAKLMLANHGYREKQEVEHSGDMPTINIRVVDGKAENEND